MVHSQWKQVPIEEGSRIQLHGAFNQQCSRLLPTPEAAAFHLVVEAICMSLCACKSARVCTSAEKTGSLQAGRAPWDTNYFCSKTATWNSHCKVKSSKAKCPFQPVGSSREGAGPLLNMTARQLFGMVQYSKLTFLWRSLHTVAQASQEPYLWQLCEYLILPKARQVWSRTGEKIY